MASTKQGIAGFCLASPNHRTQPPPLNKRLSIARSTVGFLSIDPVLRSIFLRLRLPRLAPKAPCFLAALCCCPSLCFLTSPRRLYYVSLFSGVVSSGATPDATACRGNLGEVQNTSGKRILYYSPIKHPPPRRPPSSHPPLKPRTSSEARLRSTHRAIVSFSEKESLLYFL